MSLSTTDKAALLLADRIADRLARFRESQCCDELAAAIIEIGLAERRRRVNREDLAVAVQEMGEVVRRADREASEEHRLAKPVTL